MSERCPACDREGPHRTLGGKGAYAGGGPSGVWTVVAVKKCRCGHIWALRYLEDRTKQCLTMP
jgi:hypothetical protein